MRERVYGNYDQTFREEALRLVERGRSMNDVADSLGVGRTTLQRWYNRDMVKKGKRPKRNAVLPVGDPSTESAEEKVARLEKENAQLRKENEALQMDRAILKKAAAFFAKESE